MSGFETEDQQVEEFKKWWKENGKAVVIGVVLGISAVVGVRMYMNHLEKQRIEASIAFERMNMALQQQQTEAAASLGDQVVLHYPGTPYAALASLALARQDVDKGELDAAQNRLQWIIENEKQPDIVHIARLRLARVLFAAGKIDQALTLLTDVDMEAYTPLYQELRGDLYLAKQQPAEARAAYVAALDALANKGDLQVLQMKLDDLGG